MSGSLPDFRVDLPIRPLQSTALLPTAESIQSARSWFRSPLSAIRFLTFYVALLSAVLYTGAAIALQPAAGEDVEPADGSWWGVVTKDDLIMRCGHSEFYYSVGTLKAGDVVKVIKVNKRILG